MSSGVLETGPKCNCFSSLLSERTIGVASSIRTNRKQESRQTDSWIFQPEVATNVKAEYLSCLDTAGAGGFAKTHDILVRASRL